MSVRFLHTADWQIGARFRQFGDRAETLRTARLETLRRTLGIAAETGVDAFLVAGDLFEDDQVELRAVEDVVTAFRDAAPLKIFVLPGNHDPLTGPGCLWNRAPFDDPPTNVIVLRDSTPIALAPSVYLIPSPLTQKTSTLDPTLPIGKAAADLPPDAIRIGITHGSLAIEGRHKPDDFPIAIDAASRHGLDYLAIGHWHSWFPADGGRILMPGTPEPTSFTERESGQVAEVTIEAHGSVPVIRRVPTAGLEWERQTIDLTGCDGGDPATIAHSVAEPARTVLRVVLEGIAAPFFAKKITADLVARDNEFAALQIDDKTVADLHSAELAAVLQDHPMVAEVAADLNRAITLAGGQSAEALPSDLDPAALGELFAAAALPPAATDQERLALLFEASRLLGAALPEVVREN